MIKYIPQDTTVVFSEIPDEITLAVNVSNCQNNCPGCHSSYLRENIGEELTKLAVDELLEGNSGITCFCFMGEGNDPKLLKELILYMKEKYPKVKIALYSGREHVDEDFYWETLDYLKIGPYVEVWGALDSPTTNQRLYALSGNEDGIFIHGKFRPHWVDITSKFWKH